MVQTLLILIGLFLAVKLIRRGSDDSDEAVLAGDSNVLEDLWDHRAHPYHCVACKCGEEDCAGVAGLKDKLFLVGDDHRLPVPECTAVRCRCRYVHYPDRRGSEDDRRASFGLEQEMYKFNHDRDRRLSLGRRAEDWSDTLEINAG